MGALPESSNPLARALEEELAAVVSPDSVRRIVTAALRDAQLAEMPTDGRVLAAFVDVYLRKALAAVLGDDSADDMARRLVELARRSSAAPAPQPQPAMPLARVTSPGLSQGSLRPAGKRPTVTEVTGPATRRRTPVFEVNEAPFSAPPGALDAMPPPPFGSQPAIVVSTQPPAAGETPVRQLSRMRPTMDAVPVPRTDAPETSAPPPPRSGQAARQVKLTPRPRMRALSDASRYTPPPFRPSGDMQASGRAAELPTHKPMPALSSFVVVVTEDQRTGEALAGELSELSVNAFVRGTTSLPAAGDAPSVFVLDARQGPVDEGVLARLLWRMGTKVVVWGDDEALRQMRRGYGRADHLVRCHAEVSGRELAHVCQMLLG